ncbi:MAG: hypothetical protein ACXVSX_12485 [Solirubrobacteraceae bacterium]
MRTLARLVPAVLAAALLLPAAAQASGAMRTAIADDRALLQEPSDARAEATVRDWAALGIDDVRILVEWDRIAPAATSPSQPAFDARDPDSPAYDFGAVDRAVRLATAGGLHPIVSVTGPGPLWASASPSRGQARYKPRPDLFGQFAAAVARRYGAVVDTYVLWNEPNLPLWLQPQNTCSGRRCTPYAPHLYRRLVRAAYPEIKAADANATVLFGALAPRGDRPMSANARTKPLAFIRAMACVDARFHRDRKGPCAGFHPLTGDGFAYHPHATTFSPTTPRADLDEASIADLPRLERTLDAAQRAGGLKAPGGAHFGLWLTEWGYQTRPPDPIQGVTLSQQSRWLQVGARIAWHDPRVRLLTQYEWRDEPLGRGNVLVKYSGWQSGLRFADDRPKPSLATFPNPFDVTVRGHQATLWGQVRPGASHQVTVQRRRPGTTRWIGLRTLWTNASGFWSLRQPLNSPQQFRFTWQPDAAPLRGSDAVTVRPR